MQTRKGKRGREGAPSAESSGKGTSADDVRRSLQMRALWSALRAELRKKAKASVTASAVAPLLEVARREIMDSVFGGGRKEVSIGPAYAVSDLALNDYHTVDVDHVRDILGLVRRIEDYAADNARSRPLNILMLAAPGAGKSHFIACVAECLREQGLQAVNYNMAGVGSISDLAYPLDEVRNLKVADRVPLLFLDEFDADPRYYAALLPLMWDGKAQLGHRTLSLGKVVVVLAGSRPEVQRTMQTARKMGSSEGGDGPGNEAKLTDLLSRINGGVLEIPSLDLVAEQRDRRPDKVCIALKLLRNRYGTQLEVVPRALLRFVGMVRFRYGVRGIAHLVDLLPRKANARKLSIRGVRLPLRSAAELEASSMAFHLTDDRGLIGVMEKWGECIRSDVDVHFGVSVKFKVDVEAASAEGGGRV